MTHYNFNTEIWGPCGPRVFFPRFEFTSIYKFRNNRLLLFSTLSCGVFTLEILALGERTTSCRAQDLYKSWKSLRKIGVKKKVSRYVPVVQGVRCFQQILVGVQVRGKFEVGFENSECFGWWLAGSSGVGGPMWLITRVSSLTDKIWETFNNYRKTAPFMLLCDISYII